MADDTSSTVAPDATARVVVVGSLNVDRGWRVTRHPREGETILGTSAPAAPGGKGLNQAVAAARMGAPVTLVGAVGADDDGRWLRSIAAAEGIDVTGVAEVDDVPTGTALVVVDDAGANTVTVDAGANAALTPTPPTLGPGDVVVAQLEVPAVAVAAALAEARRVGARSVLNPSPLGAGRTLTADADVVVVNQHEAADLLEGEVAQRREDALAQARTLATGSQIVIVTLGAGGVVAWGPEGAVEIPGRPVEAVDTTGAGDGFLGVLAAGLVAGRDLPSALERANRAAAAVVTRSGTVAAMATAAELDGP